MRTVLDRDGVAVSDVTCRHDQGRGVTTEHTGDHQVVLVRRGCFVRSADGVATLLDPTLGYCMRPGDEERYDHPHAHGDDCTSIRLSPGLVATLWGGDLKLPPRPLHISAQVDLQHRLLLATARRADDPHELLEQALDLAAAALQCRDAERVASARPATARARRALADSVREALAEDPNRSLPALATELAVSPHHLSRIFKEATGHTIARHRMHLRVRVALQQLAGGERDLARLAADTGFADQSHLTRVMRDEVGETPGRLRAVLGELGLVLAAARAAAE